MSCKVTLHCGNIQHMRVSSRYRGVRVCRHKRVCDERVCHAK